MLKIRDRGSRKIDTHGRRHEGAGKWTVQYAATKSGFRREGLIDVKRVKVAEQSRRRHQMAFGNRQHVIKGVAHCDFVE